MNVSLPFAHGFYKSDSLPVSAQECVNVYAQIPDAPSFSEAVLFGIPGLSQKATAGASFSDANRGSHTLNGTPYFVCGGTLYRMNSDYTLDNLGSISGSGKVSMADNGTQLMILVPGGNGYIFTTGPDTLTTISDVDFTANGNPQYVKYIDGYFVCVTDDKKFILSDLNNGLSYNALQFGTAESNPDGTVAPIVFNNQLFIGGQTTIEQFNNIGGTGFPFTRTGLFLNVGVSAPLSLIRTSSAFFWIGAGEGEGPAIWTYSAGETIKVSTQAIDAILERLTATELSAVHAWTYAQAGHYFVGFVLPSTALVFDQTTQLWHERKSQVTNPDSTVSTKAWRATSLVSAYGNIYAGDCEDGRVGLVDIDEYGEYGNDILSQWATQPFHNEMMPFFVPKLELVMESGVGNSDVEDPVIALSLSKDGGRTWTDDRTRCIGKVGEYSRRAIWRRNGRASQSHVYRFRCSDQVKKVGIRLVADIRRAA